MIMNELKTKVLVFGSQTKVNIDFNGKAIEQVESYKYLGNIVNAMHSYKADAFSKNYEYSSGQNKKTMFSIKKQILKSKYTYSRLLCVLSSSTATMFGV